MARTADFDLAAALATPSFTPGQRDIAGLVALVIAGDDPVAGRAAIALAQLGDAARIALDAADREPDEGARGRLVAALGLLARRADPAARALVIARIGDASHRVRRAAAIALGKLGPKGGLAPTVEENDAVTALIARWDASDVTPDERRALAEALGKVGGEPALARLRALDPGTDAELARRRDRALLMAKREGQRADDSQIRVDVAPPAPIAVRLHCKPGLAGLLVNELRAHMIEARADGDADVELPLAAPWSTLYASRLWMTGGIRIPRPDGDLAESIIAALTAAPTRALLRAWTAGPIRWRLQLPHGRQRAVVWRVARDVTAAAPELVNDPTATTWDVHVDDRVLELVPRRALDARFAYRVADLPAASHPTVAAALARVAEARPGDRVWDPFVGSGLELIERARLGPYASLSGTDLAESALDAARANLAAAAVTATLAHGDSRAATGAGDLDLVITNPPLGSRVHVDAGKLLVEALPVIARRLARGGRLVWITPAPRETSPAALRVKLRRTLGLPIDLGGVRGQLERWEL